MRLNGWQRIGIVLSVLWFLVGGFSGTIAQELPSQAPQGTEFWPPFLGYRLKITDSLLALFTLLLVIVGGWQASQLRRTVQSRITAERPQIHPGPFNTSKLRPSGALAAHPLADEVPPPIIDWTPRASFEKFAANLSWRPVCLGGGASHIQKFCLLN